MLFELIGLKIIFDVAVRDVGTTPSWDRDILYSHFAAETGTLRQGFVSWFGSLKFYLLKPYLPSQLNTQDALSHVNNSSLAGMKTLKWPWKELSPLFPNKCVVQPSAKWRFELNWVWISALLHSWKGFVVVSCLVGFLFHFCFDKKIKTNVVLEQTEGRQVWDCAGGFLWSVFVLQPHPWWWGGHWGWEGDCYLPGSWHWVALVWKLVKLKTFFVSLELPEGALLWTSLLNGVPCAGTGFWVGWGEQGIAFLRLRDP